MTTKEDIVKLLKRFWKRVIKTDNCWIWQGAIDARGYGRFHIAATGKHQRAHRYSYELHYGPIPDGLDVCHTCDNPICVRPDHLWVGTVADNMHDRDKKERQARGEGNGRHKLTEVEVRAIRTAYAKGNISTRKLAVLYDIHYTTIHDIVTGKRWGWLKP